MRLTFIKLLLKKQINWRLIHWWTGVKDRRTFSHFVLLSRLMPSQVGKEIPTVVFWNITERNCRITGAKKKCKPLIKCWSDFLLFLLPNGHLTLYGLRYCPDSISHKNIMWVLIMEASSCHNYSLYHCYYFLSFRKILWKNMGKNCEDTISNSLREHWGERKCPSWQLWFCL